MRKILIMILASLLSGCAAPEDYQVKMDPDTKNRVEKIVQTSGELAEMDYRGTSINSISAAFLDTPYQANTLIGSADSKEVLVANFNGVDCFTFLDYVKALESATDKNSFMHNLINTRYVNGKVDFLSRRHFFSDWYATTPVLTNDITDKVSNNYVVVTKKLNLKKDGSVYIPDLAVVPRKIKYIPATDITDDVLRNIQDGDFIGIYSPLSGLDVSHVGIAIIAGGEVMFRNASALSKNRKVVDTPLREYIKTSPGIIVLRSRHYL